MVDKSLKAFLYCTILLLLINFFIMDREFFAVISVVLLYVFITHLITRYTNKLGAVTVGIINGLLCFLAPFIFLWIKY